MKKFAGKLFLVFLLSAASSASGAKELVLIVSATSNIDQLDSSVIRKLFLGLTVTQHQSRLRPVLNKSDRQIQELFLQNIVSMSDSTYDRYILRLVLQQGRSQPIAYKSNSEVVAEVASDPAVVGYAWASEVAHDARVKVLRVLWHD